MLRWSWNQTTTPRADCRPEVRAFPADIAHTDELGSTTRESRLASDRERTSSWRNPEVASSSGGHVTPDYRPASLLDEPPVAAQTRQGPTTESPTRMERRLEPEERPTTERRRRRLVMRRVRREIKRVDPVSVLRLSLFFYAVFLGVWLFFWGIVYEIVASSSLFSTLHELGNKAVVPALTNFNMSLWDVEKWAFLIGLLIAGVGSLLNALFAFLYNLGADLVGGVGITFVERDV